MRKFPQLAYLFVVLFFNFLVSCSSDDDGGSDNNDTGNSEVIDDNDSDTGTDNDTPDTGNTEVDNNDTETDNGDTDSGTEIENEEGEVDMSSLTERFVFDENIYIENSYFEEECQRIPCRTDDESLGNVFDNGNVPDDVYFSLSEDRSELILQCLPDLGRRIEFKQRSEGSLDVPASLEMEGVFEDIPDAGITIAQVHNRGAGDGETNRPFFRLVLFRDGLETVIRRDPVVAASTGLTMFSRCRDIPFYNGEDYDLTPLRIIVSKSEGQVHINVWQKGISILDKSFSPEESTRWIDDEGIANGFYLKGGIYNDEEENFTENLVARFTTVIFDSEDTDSI